jgi:hypothetical protein
MYIYSDSDLPSSPDLSDLLSDMSHHLRMREKYIYSDTDPARDSCSQALYQPVKSLGMVEILTQSTLSSVNQNDLFLAIDDNRPGAMVECSHPPLCHSSDSGYPERQEIYSCNCDVGYFTLAGQHNERQLTCTLWQEEDCAPPSTANDGENPMSVRAAPWTTDKSHSTGNAQLQEENLRTQTTSILLS